MKKPYLLIIIGVLAGILLVVTIKGLSNEDDWICVNGGWVKHGNPSSPMPTTNCQENDTSQLKNIPQISVLDCTKSLSNNYIRQLHQANFG